MKRMLYRASSVLRSEESVSTPARGTSSVPTPALPDITYVVKGLYEHLLSQAPSYTEDSQVYKAFLNKSIPTLIRDLLSLPLTTQQWQQTAIQHNVGQLARQQSGHNGGIKGYPETATTKAMQFLEDTRSQAQIVNVFDTANSEDQNAFQVEVCKLLTIMHAHTPTIENMLGDHVIIQNGVLKIVPWYITGDGKPPSERINPLFVHGGEER